MIAVARSRTEGAGRLAVDKPIRLRLSSKKELLRLGLLSSVLVLAIFLRGSDLKISLVIIGSLLLSAVLCAEVYAQLKASSVMIWNPLIWFRAGSVLFFGIGNLVPYLANVTTIEYVRLTFDFTSSEAITVVAVTSCSIMVVLSVAYFFSVPIPRKWSLNGSFLRDRSRLKRFALLFLAVGFVFRYGFILPSMLGFVQADLPGWFRAMSSSYSAGLFLLILWCLIYSQKHLLIPAILVLVDVFMGVLLFDKSEIALTVIFSFLAFLYYRFNYKRLFFGIILVLVVIYFGQSPAHYGRYYLKEGAGSLGDRVEIVTRYISEGDEVTRWSGDELNPLLRLSYLNVAAFVVNEWDSGRPGPAHDNAWAAAVPRLLWSNKPRVGESGGYVYWLLRGRTGASVGAGHFAEAYWSFGWLGCLIVFIPGGLILSLISLFSVKAIIKRDWLMLPVVLYGISIAYKVSGSWVPTIVGGGATFASMAIAVYMVKRIALVSNARTTN